jgi:diguanylate cyclase (GGDEF)-like protein
VTTGISIGKIVAASVYPVTDLLLTFSVAAVLLRATDPSTRGPLSLLAGAAASFIIGDVCLGYLRSHGLSVKLIDKWPLLIYLTAHLLLAAACLNQHRQAGRSRAATGGQRQVPVSTRLPYAAVVLGYTLMTVAAAGEKRLFPWSGLVLGSVCITAVVIARQMVMQRESHRLAGTDALTGLANRAQLYDTVARALERAEKSGRSTAVILADMNGFKRINDTLGHQAGDQMLGAFGQVLRRGVFGSDVAARLGGDEFAIVLHDIGEIGNAEAVLRRIRAEMIQPVTMGDRSVTLQASFGVAVCGPGQAGTDDLLHRADLAMYRAKREKNAGWVCYEPSMENSDGQLLEDDLRHAR